jgi:hypothetical protein
MDEQFSKLEKREEVWVRTWLEVARAEDCKSKTVPTAWADQCLADFDSRFPQNKQP